MKKKVLVTYNMFRSGYAELVEQYDVTFPPDGAESFTYEEVLRMIPEYDALQSMFNFPVDKQLMDAGVKLKIISNYAVGYDNIDIPYANAERYSGHEYSRSGNRAYRRSGYGDRCWLSVDVFRSWTGVSGVGEVKVGLLENLGHSLYGGTIGNYRYGTYRTSVSPTGGCGRNEDRSIGNRHRVAETIEDKYKAVYLSLDELLRVSDVVSVNAPYTTETYHLIGERELSLTKPTSILINTARGPLVDEKALVKALREKVIWGAGLDVFEFGDYPSEELLSMDNVVLNPHTGTQTFEVRNEMAAFVSRNIIHFFEGGPVAKVNHID